MTTPTRTRFWLELGLSLTGCALLVLTAISRSWIESLTGLDPDGGSGALEWAIVAVLFVSTVVCAWLARREWRASAATIG